ncbi:hypothetical protein [Tenacibaculum sp. IB213877]|uniref:hypothetical protein n=1 Tax=Tenacibaculum sp. IB213877 TaxID=3097351 RepID=UPI002A5A5C8B|nr:hypothetical protein [Tenacibaculum sp. IB213877]MDY0779372.1 hypothetical protein [Tenacibaculum sp. IB213877]
MKKIPLQALVKGSLLFIVYSILAVYFLFFVPFKVPEKSSLQTVTIPSDSLQCMLKKRSDKSYLSAWYEGTEIKSIELDKKKCLNILGSNEYFLRIKQKTENYTLMISEKAGLFRKTHALYQVSDDKEVLLPYEESAEVFQNQRNLFRYLSIGFFALMFFILGNTLYQKMKAK